MLQDFIESLPSLEYPLDLEYFSPKKKLFDYQQNALKNAYRFLYYYYVEIKEDKESLWEEYTKRGFEKDWEGNSEILKKHFKEWEIDYKTFVNRAGFWMATGSGKTLVIVKLIELLDYLMKEGIIPKKDILFLTQRDDLIESFKRHVEEYNQGRERKIILEELKNFHTRKANPQLYDRENILVFYYRADLISDRKGEKILHYENYHNDGNWYLILDEAHKGDNEESKRKQIFMVFTKNGFLFNFSATFTEEFDKASTVFRFNLADFIRGGYGKHIAVMETQTIAFKKKDTEYTDEEKREIIIKLLILTGFLRKIRDKKYPSPLAVVLVNTVNTEDADLKLFFKELFHIAEKGIDEETFVRLKNELFSELSEVKFWAEEEKLRDEDIDKLNEFTLRDFYEHFFSSPGPAEVEIIYHPENKQEIAFQLKNADKPFAVIKIGDVTNWLKTLSENIITRELFEREEFFLNIDEKENISLLAGSRSFYEGWDSPRPNVIAYINIGSKDAQKFVLQSLGRGVRIKIVDEEKEYRKRQDFIRTLETLYVFATNRRNVLSVINETLKSEKEEEWEALKGIERNPHVSDKELLIPVYKISEVKLKTQSNFYAGSEDYAEAKAFVSNIDSLAVLSILTGKELEVCKELSVSFANSNGAIKTSGRRIFKDPLILLRKFADYLSLDVKEVDRFDNVDDKINHYRKIEVNIKKFEPSKKESLEKIIETEISIPNFEGIAIEWFEKHFYLPILRAADGTRPNVLDWIRRIIKHQSEIKFIKDLVENHSCLDEISDWWMFSRIDEKTDEVYIPYYKNGNEFKWYPDFILWLSKGKDYYIIFVDPKGTVYSESYFKLDGAKKLFEAENGTPKVFEKDEREIKVLFLFYSQTPKDTPEAYRSYWINGIEELCRKVKQL